MKNSKGVKNDNNNSSEKPYVNAGVKNSQKRTNNNNKKKKKKKKKSIEASSVKLKKVEITNNGKPEERNVIFVKSSTNEHHKINYVERKINNLQKNSKCSFCGDKDEK